MSSSVPPAAVRCSREERATMHAANERNATAKLADAGAFFNRFAGMRQDYE